MLSPATQADTIIECGIQGTSGIHTLNIHIHKTTLQSQFTKSKKYIYTIH